jgi:hypothetical protein
MSSQARNQAGDRKLSQCVPGDLVRPRYSPGLILEDSDLTAAVEHGRDLSRLLFRTLFGCGVVCGLRVGVETKPELAVSVAPGLALNGCGDPIQLSRSVTIGLESQPDLLADRKEGGTGPSTKDLWVVLRAGERLEAPRELVCDADEIDIHRQPTRIRATAGVAILFAEPKCLCRFRAAAAEEDLKIPDEAVDWAPDGGCGQDCDGDCPVLLARLHWKQGWHAIHAGERRYLRPTFEPDPLQQAMPDKK